MVSTLQAQNTKLALDAPFWSWYQTGMNQLRKFRLAKGLSQAKLAELVGTSQPQIKRLETGDRKLTREWAELIAPHLGTDAQSLIFGDGEPDSEEAGSTYEQIGRRLSKVRVSLGFDQLEMALRLDITPGEWNAYEEGLSLIDLGSLAKLLDLMPGLASDWVLFGNRSKLTIDADRALKAAEAKTKKPGHSVAQR